jgi:ribose 1,5-bisphosphokinase PhnN
MNTLDMVLDQVRQSDRDAFRKKITAMEEVQAKRLKEQGLENMSDILERVYNTDGINLTVREGEQVIQPPVQKEAPKSGSDVYKKFLDSIK